MRSSYTNENEVFLRSMQGVRRLASGKDCLRDDVQQRSLAAQATTQLQQKTSVVSLQNPVNPVYDSRWHSQFEQLKFQRSQVSRDCWRKLSRGQLPIVDEVDLHGYTIEQARLYLQQYFATYEASTQGDCMRIIHGKGLNSVQCRVGSLKRHVAHWLPQIARILAFVSCQPKDGGSGAVYVLVK